MRIVGGEFRGRRLATPSGLAVRPTADRLRQTLFDILAHGQGNRVRGARVLDLFAGTGALGLEAMSRGAAYVLFVENDAEARALVRRNVEALGLTGHTRIFRRDAADLGPAGNIVPFDLVFADPPYRQGLGERALAGAVAGGWLSEDAVAILEESVAVEVAPIPGLEPIDRRHVGDSQLLFFRRTGKETG